MEVRQMTVENRKQVEALTSAFLALSDRCQQKRYSPAIIADVAFRIGLSFTIGSCGIRETAEMCRRLGVELQRFCDGVDLNASKAA